MIKEALKQQIEIALASACKQGLLGALQGITEPVVIEHARKPAFGDFACGLPLRLARASGIEATKIAEILCDILDPELRQFAIVEPVKPGFLNFGLKHLALQNVLRAIHAAGDDFGACQAGGTGKRIYLACPAANVSEKAPSLDGQRALVYAENLANLLKFSGFELSAESKQTEQESDDNTIYDIAIAIQCSRAASTDSMAGFQKRSSDRVIIKMNHVAWAPAKSLLSKEACHNTDIAADIGPTAIRFLLAESNPQVLLRLDSEQAKFCGRKNRLFSIQYAYARCAAMLRQALEPAADLESGLQLTPLVSSVKWQYWQSRYRTDIDAFSNLFDSDDYLYCKMLILHLSQFPEEIAAALQENHPGRLAAYALSIANAILNMFEQTSLFSTDEAKLCCKLGLIRAAMQVMENAFKILGIELQARM